MKKILCGVEWSGLYFVKLPFAGNKEIGINFTQINRCLVLTFSYNYHFHTFSQRRSFHLMLLASAVSVHKAL